MSFTRAREEWAEGNRRPPLTSRETDASPNGHSNGNGKVDANGNGRVNGNGHPNGNGNGHHSNGNGHHENGNGRLPALSPAGNRRALSNGNGARTSHATVSVVIPALNEAENLPHVLPRIPSWVDEVVLVDGLSVDGTVELAKSLIPHLRVVEHVVPGKGAALQAGFLAARGDIVITLDADGSADPAEIPAFVGTLLAGADFAKGSRFLQGGGTADMGPLRRAGNWGLRALVRIGFGGRYSDLCYGYNAFWRERVVPAIEGEADGFEIETLMNVRVLAAGLKVAEVPSYEAARIHGESHLRTFRDGFRVLRTIVREWVRARRLGKRLQREGRSEQRSAVKRVRRELESADALAD